MTWWGGEGGAGRGRKEQKEPDRFRIGKKF